MSVGFGLLSLFLFKHKTEYEVRISDWSSDVCSSDLGDVQGVLHRRVFDQFVVHLADHADAKILHRLIEALLVDEPGARRGHRERPQRDQRRQQAEPVLDRLLAKEGLAQLPQELLVDRIVAILDDLYGIRSEEQ